MLVTDQLRETKNFTNTDRQIANYVLNNLNAVSKMTVQQLAQKSFTSHSAIIRLAKKLGYTGYRDFRYAITIISYQNQHQLDPIDANFPFLPKDSPRTIAKNMATLTQNTIERALAQLDVKELTKAAKIILTTKNIFLFATGDSQIRARSFQNKLVKINKTAIIADEYGESLWKASSLNSEDCAIFISYGGNSELYLHILHMLNDRGVKTILITGNPDSKYIPLVDVAISVFQNEYENLKISTFVSQITLEYILNTLFGILYAHDYQENLSNLKRNYHAIEDNDH
ncbi:MurR/RpiR family transcriptional regulator [Pediococcus siamensis]|uniref:MurR/RpiR family transcriptional regulator n=1 Tax=Pediococcus siamensis TaxID=381829 RepID=UPI0039A1E025